MRFTGNILKNMKSAEMSKDNALKRDIVLDEVAFLIKQNKSVVVDALNNSGVKTSENASVSSLINKVVNNIYENKEFQQQISTAIANFHSKGVASTVKTKGGFSNVSGDTASAIATALGQATSSIFNFAASKKELEKEKEASKSKLYEKLLGGKKTNWLPIIIVGGVLIIGGIVAFSVLRKK